MEMDGTGYVLPFTVDECRAELQSSHHVFDSAPHSGDTSEETSQEINGFPEPPELKDGDPEADTSGEPGCFGEIDQSRNLHRSGVRLATSGLVNGEDGFHATEGTNGGLNTSGDPSGTRSSRCVSGGNVCADGPLRSSGRVDTPDARAADVFRSMDSTLVIGESYNQATSAGTSGATANTVNCVGETVDPSDGEDAAIWESDIIPDVIGISPGESSNNHRTSGEVASTQWTSVETPSTSTSDEVVDFGGSHVRSSTWREQAGTRRTSASPDLSEEISGICENIISLKVTEKTEGTVRTISEQVLTTHEKIRTLDVETDVTGDFGAFPQDRVAGNSRLRNCFGKRPSSCCTEMEMEIPNGELHLDCEGTFPHKAPDKGIRVGNCGYLVINRRTVSGTPVYSMGEPWNVKELQQEARSTWNFEPETFSKRSVATDTAGASEQVMKTRPEDGVGAARPQSLRTKPGQGVSLSCDSTPLDEDHMGCFVDDGDMDVIMNSLELGRRQSAPEKLQESEHVHPGGSADQTESRRNGFADFFTRSLFSWKPRETKVTAAASGWRLFGKMSSWENTTTTTTTKTSRVPQQQPDPVRRKNLEFEPLSTTGLILEDRPVNLPAKSEEEAQRHRQQYDEMMAGARRRELKDAQRKKKQMKERHRQEEKIARAVVVWNTEILPNWENVRNTRRVRDLWWQGLPPSIRGKIWSLAIGNELNITPELYEIFLSRAKEKWRSYSETGSLSESEDCGADKESSLDLIKLDIFRTFPSLYIFQKGGPYHDILHNVLGAYTCYRPDVGYVQGMSFIAAVLILNLEEADAFIAFANLLNKPCQMAFFRVDHDLMLKYFAAFEVFFKENLPKLFQHFHNNSLSPDFYLIDWIFTLYSKPLPLDVACRVWDLFCRDGEEALFRTALGILRLYHDVLLQMDFIHIAQFLSRLPQNTPAHALFHAIANTDMLSNGGRWNQVFSALMKDGSKDADKTGSPALRS